MESYRALPPTAVMRSSFVFKVLTSHFQSEEFFLRLSDHVPDCMDSLVLFKMRCRPFRSNRGRLYQDNQSKHIIS